MYRASVVAVSTVALISQNWPVAARNAVNYKKIVSDEFALPRGEVTHAPG